MLPKIAFVGTGGTISSLGADQFDLLDYNAGERRISAAELVETVGIQGIFTDILPINFRVMDSTAITSDDWADLAETCVSLINDESITGLVIGHGTASLEETAWVLSLVLGSTKPVVLTGSMRPLSGISSDANANLAAAVRVASDPMTPGGVWVVMNDEIHSPRTVSKTHTLRLSAFQSPWLGPVGLIDGTNIEFKRTDVSSGPVFNHHLLRALPRVDITYSHVGADGVAAQAFVDAGALGLVSAGFGPGMATPQELAVFEALSKQGVVIVQSSRTPSGWVVDSLQNQEAGIIAGSDIGPQKARILLALCLAEGYERAMISAVFERL